MKLISTVCVTVLMLGSAYARAQSGEDQTYEEAEVPALRRKLRSPPSAAPADVPAAPPQQLPPPPQAPVQQGYPQASAVQAPPPRRGSSAGDRTVGLHHPVRRGVDALRQPVHLRADEHRRLPLEYVTIRRTAGPG